MSLPTLSNPTVVGLLYLNRTRISSLLCVQLPPVLHHVPNPQAGKYKITWIFVIHHSFRVPDNSSLNGYCICFYIFRQFQLDYRRSLFLSPLHIQQLSTNSCHKLMFISEMFYGYGRLYLASVFVCVSLYLARQMVVKRWYFIRPFGWCLCLSGYRQISTFKCFTTIN